MNASGLIYSGLSGVAGGAIGGSFTRVTRYDPYSPHLDQQLVRSLNNEATIKSNTGISGLGRNFLGSFVGNTDWPPMQGSAVSQCGRQ